MTEKNIRQPLKKTLKILAIASAVILLIIGALLIWLRTSSGTQFVFRHLTTALAEAGLNLSADEFQGPLPGRIFIRNLSLADSEGVLIKAQAAELQLSPLALLRRTVHISLLKIEKPQIIRLPESETKPTQAAGEFSLPVKIRLDRLIVEQGYMNAGALSSLGLQSKEVFFKAEARANIIGDGSDAFLLADLVERDGNGLLSLKLDFAKNNNIDNLDILLEINDHPGGFLSVLLNDPEWKGLKVNLAGRGPLNNWAGQGRVLNGNIGEVAAALSFKTPNGNLWRDVIENKNLAAQVKAEFKPGESFSAQATKLIGQQADLVASVDLSGQDAKIILNITGESGLLLGSLLAGQLSAEGGEFRLEALLDGIKHPASENAQKLHLAADVSFNEKSQKLKSLLIKGDGLQCEASGEHKPGSGAIKALLDFNTKADSPLVEALMAAADLWPRDFGGDLSLAAELDWKDSTEAANGTISLSGQNLTWPKQELEKIIGPRLELRADLNGGGAKPLEFKISRATSKLLSLTGGGALKLEPDLGQSRFSLEATALLGDLSEFQPGFAGNLSLKLHSSGSPADMQANLSLEAEALTTPQGDFKKPEIDLIFSGNIVPVASNEAPDGIRLNGDLSFKADDSPGGRLELKAGWDLIQLHDLLTLSITELAGDLAGLKLSGDLDASLGENKKFDGQLKVDIASWDKLAALTGQKLSGSPANAVIKLTSSESGQAADALLDLPDFRLQSGKATLLSLKKAAINFKGDKLFSQPDIDFNLSLGSGLAGPFSWHSGQIAAKGLGGAGDLTASLAQARLNGSGGSKTDGLQLALKYDLRDVPELEFNRLDFSLAGSGLSLREKAKITLGRNLHISPFSLNFKPGGQLSAEADLTPGAMKIKAQGAKIPFKAFKAFAPDTMPEGEIQSINVDLSQQSNGLAGSFDLKTTVSAKQLKNIKPIMSLKGDLTAGAAPALVLKGQIEGGAGWKSEGLINARLPLSAGINGGAPQANMNAPVAADIKFSGPIGPLWALAGQPDRSLNGIMQLEAALSGTLAKPQPKGSLYLAGGRYEDSVLGVLVSDIKLEAHSTPELPLKALLSAKDGKKGGLALEAQVRNISKPVITAKGRLSGFSPTHRDDLVVYISGDFGAEGPVDQLLLTSNLTLDQGELDLQIITAGGSVPTLPISNIGDGINRSSRGMRADLKINIPGRFFIRGPGLESEWRGNLAIGGSTSKPSLTGQISPIRGYYSFAAKEFQFTGGDISFSGGTNPMLNLELTNQTPGLTALLRFGGTGSKPTLAMESQPALPEEEVLSHVLFGKSATEISRFEALQLASAINDLRNFGSSGFSALSMVRSSLGLDVLRLGGSNENRSRQVSSMSGSMGQELGGASSQGVEQSDDISVEAGKYLSDNIYVGVEHNGVGGAAVRLEVELAPSVSFEARSSTESSRVGLGWKKDY